MLLLIWFSLYEFVIYYVVEDSFLSDLLILDSIFLSAFSKYATNGQTLPSTCFSLSFN